MFGTTQCVVLLGAQQAIKVAGVIPAFEDPATLLMDEDAQTGVSNPRALGGLIRDV